MPREQVSIATNEGHCPATVFTPAGSGRWPAAILYMDGFGVRPVLCYMAQRLANTGHVVLLPDLFYRSGPYAPMEPKAIFATGHFRAVVGPLMDKTGNDTAGRIDTEAFIAHLDSRDDVAGRAISVTGYCMGGGMALTAAGSFPERVAAAASFHGGKLATDAPDSPHLLARGIKAEVYIASADNDPSCPPEMIARLDKALIDGKVEHRCETYAGTKHGWTMQDFPVYDADAGERHWRELTELFARRLANA